MKQRYFPTFNQYLNEQEVNEAIFDPALLQELNALIKKIKALYKKVDAFGETHGHWGTMDKYNAEIQLEQDDDTNEVTKKFVVMGKALGKSYEDLVLVFFEKRHPSALGNFSGGRGKVRNILRVFRCTLGSELEFNEDTFKHEMIHYKDYLRNDLKFSKSYDHTKDWTKYMSTPHEFLAHTQEAIMRFADMFISLPKGVPDDFNAFMKMLDTRRELSSMEMFDKKYRKKYRKNIYKLWEELKSNAMAYKLIFNIVKGKLPTDMDTSKLIQAIKQIQDNDSEFIINWKRKHFKRTLSKLKKAHDNGDFFDFNDDSDELNIVLQQAR